MLDRDSLGFAIRLAFLIWLFAISAFTSLRAAEKSNATQLAELARSGSPALRDAIAASFAAKDLENGTAWAGRGPDFFFATKAAAKPELLIDGAAGPPMQGLAGSELWYAAARIELLGRGQP